MPDYSYRTLDFTQTFLETFASRDFTAADRKQFTKALRLFDQDERHPSLNVHALQGDREGSWSMYASAVLRLTFERLPNGRKCMLTCNRHYDR